MSLTQTIENCSLNSFSVKFGSPFIPICLAIKQLITDEIIETEYPSKDWLLSEIITPLIINSDELQKYLSQKDEFFAPSKIKKIDRIRERIKSEFGRRKNFDDFIFKARKIIA